MSLALCPFVPNDGVFVISDNTGTPKTWTVLYENGTFKAGDFSEGQRQLTAFKDKTGATYSIRATGYIDVEWEFEADLVGWADGTDASLVDVIAKLGTWSTAVSMLPTARGGYDAYLLKCVWTVERSNYAGSDVTLTLKYNEIKFGIATGVPGKIQVKGTARIMSHDISGSVAFA